MTKDLSLKPLDGIVLINKPQGLTSNGTLQRAKRLFSAKKAGHTGSLDPLATGMLPLCFGEATKVSQYLLNADKCYEVEGLLGVTTDTGDSMGDAIASVSATHCTEEMLSAVLPTLSGAISQVPPMYSALKHQGTPLYKYARQGVTIERAPRDVMIYDITLRFFKNPIFALTVTCSKGTYIRSLVESIGHALHVGAHVTALHRVYTAGFEQEPMYTLEEIEQFSLDERMNTLLPISRGIPNFPCIILTHEMIHTLRLGQAIHSFSADIPRGLVQLQDETGDFVGLGEFKSDDTLISKRLISF